MAEKKIARQRKGRFGRLGLPIAKGYLSPPRRGRVLVAGLLLGAAVAIFVALDAGFFDSRHLSGGPLSSAHAILREDCSACHGGAASGLDRLTGGGVTDAACSTCHEKFGDSLGLHTFAAHYVYRSGDFQRVTTREHEMACATCHSEHRGSSAPITEVADARCLVCHEGHSFAKDHPAFSTSLEPRSDDSSLSFAHGRHTREVMKRLGLVDLERACLACHEPDARGRGFQPINFDRHCDACHLQAGIATPRLPLASDPGDPGEIGVASLETIRSSGEPGSDWALFMDPGEFRTAGQSVLKTPLHHEDPWILDNLRRLRHRLFPDAGLADLLTSSADLPTADLRQLYREAVEALEEQIVGLRGSSDPGVQDQLAAMEKILTRVRRALDDPSVALDETEFLLAFDRPADLPASEKEEIEQLVTDLTQPCTSCHRVSNATIARVREDQKTLVRAEFNHRAHVIQRRCLDCHNQIPILDALSGPDANLDPAVDSAEIHNLPTIETCRDCHRPRQASSSCVTCHLFHPDTVRQASLLLYADEAPAAPVAPATDDTAGKE